MRWWVLWMAGCVSAASPEAPIVDEEATKVQEQSMPTPPVFQSSVSPISKDLASAMVGVSWHEGCPVALDSLREVAVSHYGVDGVRSGLLVVHEDAAAAVVRAFAAAFEAGFVVQRVRPVHEFGGDDGRSMSANNTSAFNCRRIKGTKTWSEHSWGRAIDVNPRINPWVRGDQVDPPEGREYLDRNTKAPGLLVADSAMTRAFVDSGWGWGGTWTSRKDYQHFSASGR